MEQAASATETTSAEPLAISPEWLAANYATAVLRFATLLSPMGVEPEDVAQDALVTAIRRLDAFDPRRGSVQAWLWRIVVSRARDAGRAARRQELLHDRLARWREPSEPSSPESLALDRLEDAELIAAVRRLPRRYRTVLALRYGAGLGSPEVAEALGVSRMAVVKATRRGLDKLRHELEAKP